MYKGLLDSAYWIDKYDNGEMRLIRPVFKYFLYQKCTIVSQSKRQKGKRLYNRYNRSIKYFDFVYAVHTLLIASVIPTSFVSNSYNPTATVKVAARRPHLNNASVLGTRYSGK